MKQFQLVQQILTKSAWHAQIPSKPRLFKL